MYSAPWSRKPESISRCRPPTAPQLAQAMETIITSYPAADTIHLTMDNLNIHRAKTLTDYFGKDQGEQLWNRLTVHDTPKHGSWLNQAEVEIGLFARQCLVRRRIPTLAMLQRESAAWNGKQTGTPPKSTGSSRAKRPD
jgi:hypothetical protein